MPPGESGKNDYRPVFALLKKAGYQGGISVEAAKFANIQEIGAKVLAFVKSQWTEA